MITAYRARLLLDGDGGPPVEDGVVVVDGDRIVDVTSGELGRLPAAANSVVDLGDATIVPGLVDAHTHLQWAGDATPHLFRERHSAPRVILRMAQLARRNLVAGITTVRDLGAADGLTIPLAAAIDDGDVVGPDVVACGRALAMTGGHAFQIAHEADGPEAVRAAARAEIKAGARVIKLMASGGIYDERAGLDEPQLTVAEMRAAVEEAHKAGLRVAAHAYTPGPIALALDAGVDSIEHGSYLDEATAIRMRDQGVWHVPTMTATELIVREADRVGTPAHMREKAIPTRDAGRAAAALSLRVGVRVAGGSDAGGAGIYHGSFPEELRLLVTHCGIGVPEAVRICTSAGAELCQVDGQTGRLKPGLRADVLAVHGDAVADVDAFFDPVLVLKAGRVYRGPTDVMATGRRRDEREGFAPRR